jgi:pyridoxamine 5'-phosphate oxidase
VNDSLRGRKTYAGGSLDESTIASDPFAQFHRWFEEAALLEPLEANAMALATVDPQGQPSVRMVLLRAFDSRGFVFYTNYESAKARDLAGQSRAALLFYWSQLERQVRIEGSAALVTPAESDSYFASRPRDHRLSTWASKQSRIVPDRAFIDARLRDMEEHFDGRDVERPPYWGGYRVSPHRFEFWQGRPARLHDRIVYVRERDVWSASRVAP